LSHILNLHNFSDSRGSLTVIENEINFQIRRVYYIYNVDDSIRGKHRHKTTKQALICVSGSCKVSTDDGENINEYFLNDPNLCLYLAPEDYHTMYDFSTNAVLLVLASELFDVNDYIYESYR
jgi:dTDP-4-dehydrorhamnose 3,5-epimerase-like enzyme